MLHPHTELRFVSEEVGYGIFVTQDIPCGTITWVRDCLDRKFTKEFIDSLPENDQQNALKYTYRTSSGEYYFCWDLTRFVNHSSCANSMLTPYGFEVALRDIKAGEELTNDYGTLNIIEPFSCSYIKNQGRELIRPDDLLVYFKEWDEQILQAIKKIHHCNQPLSSWLTNEMSEKIVHITQGKEELISIKTLYFANA